MRNQTQKNSHPVFMEVNRMTPANAPEGRLGRGFVILAPPQAPKPTYGQIINKTEQHDHLLAEVQTLRAQVYLGDGAIQQRQIHPSGRYIQPADDLSWHLLTVDQQGHVTAGIRYLAHRPHSSYVDLDVSAALSHLPPSFTHQVKQAVEGELAKAESLGFKYVELGAWVVGEDLRRSTEAIRMLMMIYALSQSLGGAIALSTATTRHNSAGILRRTGGKPLAFAGSDVPAYFDPHYDCEMEVLSFDSRFPNPRFSGWIGEFREALSQVPMIAPSSSPEETASDLLQLHSALTGPLVPGETNEARELVAPRSEAN
jgi:hypothetical protein